MLRLMVIMLTLMMKHLDQPTDIDDKCCLIEHNSHGILIKGMFYPFLAHDHLWQNYILLYLKAAFHMGVKDTEIGCI